MDLIEISHHDHAALNANQVPAKAYLLNGWENNILSYYYLETKGFSKEDLNQIKIKDTSFTLGNDHIELYNGIFKNEPFTDLRNGIKGCFKTCDLNMIIDVKDAIVKGKMCIRNANKDAIDTKYELSLKNAEIEMTVGVKIGGFGIFYDYIVYKLKNIDLAFLYQDNSKMSPFLDKIDNDDQKKLLTLYLSEYCIRELYPAIEYYQELCLSKYHLQQEFDESLINRNIIAIHNRRLHTAFNNLAEEIINLTNSLLEKESSKIFLTNFLGISEGANNQKIIKTFEGFICDLGSMAMIEDTNVIVSKENDIVLIHVPMKVHKFSICYKEKTGDKRCTTKMELRNSIQTYTIDDAYFYLSLKRLSQDKVVLELKAFKILNVRALSEYKDKITVDYLIMHKIEESIKEFLNKTLVSENLQEMAINPDIELDYHASDFYNGSDESSEESED